MLFTFFTYLYVFLFSRTYLEPNVGYSPSVCTITNYKFTFLFDHKTNSFKVHGLWPDSCAECPSCSYPSCCNMDQIVYEEPDDPTNFIPTKWYNTTAHNDCGNGEKVQLFEHEYIKHISCDSKIITTTDFLNKVIDLYDKYYYGYVNGKCKNYDQLWLSLDEDYIYVTTDCV